MQDSGKNVSLSGDELKALAQSNQTIAEHMGKIVEQFKGTGGGGSNGGGSGGGGKTTGFISDIFNTQESSLNKYNKNESRNEKNLRE